MHANPHLEESIIAACIKENESNSSTVQSGIGGVRIYFVSLVNISMEGKVLFTEEIAYMSLVKQCQYLALNEIELKHCSDALTKLFSCSCFGSLKQIYREDLIGYWNLKSPNMKKWEAHTRSKTLHGKCRSLLGNEIIFSYIGISKKS